MKLPNFLSFDQALFFPHDITGLTSLPEGIYPIYRRLGNVRGELYWLIFALDYLARKFNLPPSNN